jgi:hypothetical protein
LIAKIPAKMVVRLCDELELVFVSHETFVLSPESIAREPLTGRMLIAAGIKRGMNVLDVAGTKATFERTSMDLAQ